MIRSMTGYGRAKQEFSGREITVELKSVNHRYFDCNVKSPRMYGFLEEVVKKALSKEIARGKIDVYIQIDNSKVGDTKISVNLPVLQEYLRALTFICDEYGVQNDISVMELSRNSDLFKAEKEEADVAVMSASVLSVLEKALESYNTMRENEGKKLAEDILLRRGLIADMVALVEQRSPKCVEEYRQKLTERMQEVLGNSQIDAQRLLTEAAIFADKIAVTEETVRLGSHLEQLSDMICEGGAIGRKLDFLIQEFNREVNTIGSKANDLEMSKIVVDLKAEIEKIREQIQNLE